MAEKELESLTDQINDPRSKNFIMLLELTAGYWTPKQVYQGLEWINEWEKGNKDSRPSHLKPV